MKPDPRARLRRASLHPLCSYAQLRAVPNPMLRSWRNFPTLSLQIGLHMPGPLPRRLPWCLYPFLPTGRRPSRPYNPVGAPRHPYSNFRTGHFSRLQSVNHLQACRFARHPGCSHRNASRIGQPWLLLPRLSRFVTSPSRGYANRPNRATDGRGTFTLQDPQPCRLLL